MSALTWTLLAVALLGPSVGFLGGVSWLGSRRDKEKDRLIALLDRADRNLRAVYPLVSVDQMVDVIREQREVEVLAEIERREFPPSERRRRHGDL